MKISQHKAPINHLEIGKYANITMELGEDEEPHAKLKIIGTESRGSALTKYTVYVIKGQDEKG